MKKKQGLIFLSVLIMITSITLLINKSSYAAAEILNYCPKTVTLKQTNTLEFIPGLLLSNIEVTGTNGESLNNIAIQFNRDIEISSQQILEKNFEYPLEIPKFSDNKEENSYYSQLFLWYMSGTLTEEEQVVIKNFLNSKKLIEKIEE